MKHILVLGAGFAALWSAVGAAPKLEQLAIGPGVEVVAADASRGHRSPAPQSTPRRRHL